MSYDYLDDSAQQCFVYCALFDERHKIEREMLIKSFIEEGIIQEMNSQAAVDKCHSILDRLENVCLLERIDGGSAVKMHDLLRDMAIQILDEYSLVMVNFTFYHPPFFIYSLTTNFVSSRISFDSSESKCSLVILKSMTKL